MTSDAQILAPRGARGEGVDPRRWLTLIILLLAAFMNLLDVSIVNIAIPSIQRNLHASYADVQWALAGYTLAYALVLITGGQARRHVRAQAAVPDRRDRLHDHVGAVRRRAEPGHAHRQPGGAGRDGRDHGPAGAGGHPGHLPAPERIKALAGFGMTAGLGTVSGPLLGGLLIQHNLFGLDWRPIFLINVPVGIIAVAASAVLVRESRAPRPPQAGPGRRRPDQRRAAAPALPARRGPPARLARLDVRLDGGRRAGARRVHRLRAGQGRAGTARRWCR